MENTRTITIAMFSLFVAAAGASTSCDQKFTFLGLTRGSSHVLWVAEELGGECFSAQLVQAVLDDPNSTTIATDIPSRQIAWLKDAIANFAAEKPQPLDNVQGLWIAPGTNWYIKAPQPRNDLKAAFTTHVAVGGSNGSTWNKAQGPKGIVPADVGNAVARLIYFYPSGLYFDYSISQAYYFPRSGHLVVFTNQPLLAVGLDTMHGFMVLKISQ